jgi:hypothetical protein
MNRGGRGLVFTLAAAAAVGAARPAIAEDREPLQVVVVVDDQAQVEPFLDRAAKEAVRIFRGAGVTIRWLIVPAGEDGANPAHDSPLRPGGFRVRLNIQPKFRGAGALAPQGMMGAAPATQQQCGGAVYVFYDQVEGFSTRQRLDPALVLGMVTAHEVGHLLLKRPGHSSEGLMRAPWRLAELKLAALGLLLFSGPDVSAIRDTISSCRR